MRKLSDLTVLIRGGGEVASGIAFRLHMCRARVCLTEVGAPLAVARGTTYCEAVYDGTKAIMGVKAELVPADLAEIKRVWRQGNISLVIDPKMSIKEKIKPDVLIDATMAKHKTDTLTGDAPLVIGVGPGFHAGRDVDMVIESNHSANLGKVITEGQAEADTGTPVNIGGLDRERVLWAEEAGLFTSDRAIGDMVVAGQVLAHVDDRPLTAPISGMLRGLMRSGVKVPKGAKLIEVDPVHDPSTCANITTKMLAIGEGVVKAITMWLGRAEPSPARR